MSGPEPTLSDPSLERTLLGLLMALSQTRDDESTRRALAIVRPRDFSRTEHKPVFSAITYLDKRDQHFGLEAVHSLLERRGKLNGVLDRLDLQHLVSEGSRAPPLVPEEQALQVRQLGEYREFVAAVGELQQSWRENDDPPRLRAMMREVVTKLERAALVQEIRGQA